MAQTMRHLAVTVLTDFVALKYGTTWHAILALWEQNSRQWWEACLSPVGRCCVNMDKFWTWQMKWNQIKIPQKEKYQWNHIKRIVLSVAHVTRSTYSWWITASIEFESWWLTVSLLHQEDLKWWKSVRIDVTRSSNNKLGKLFTTPRPCHLRLPVAKQ